MSQLVLSLPTIKKAPSQKEALGKRMFGKVGKQ